jgi:hypothetical protein
LVQQEDTGVSTREPSERKIHEYVKTHFGDDISAYLYTPAEQRALFGKWLKIIRQSRPPLDKTPPVPRPRRLSFVNRKVRAASTGEAQDRRSKCLSQGDLGVKAYEAWKALFGSWRSFDDRTIRKLEDGKDIVLTQQLVLCLAVALEADDEELAILFEAAGFSGWNSYKARRLGVGASILTYIEQGAEDHVGKTLQAKEILHVLKLRMQAEITDASD